VRTRGSRRGLLLERSREVYHPARLAESAARRVCRWLLSALREYRAIVAGFSRDARLLLTSWTLGAIGAGAVGTLYNLYIIALGFREDFLGLLLFVGALAGGLAALPAGWLSDRLGARLAMLGGMVVLGAAMLVQYVATVAWLLLAGAAVASAAVAVASVAQTPLLYSSSTPRDRTHLFGVSDALFVTASAAGGVLAGMLVRPAAVLWPGLDRAGAYRFALLAVSLIAAASIIPLWLIRPHPSERSSAKLPPGPAGLRGMLRAVPGRLRTTLRGEATGVITRLSLTNALMGFGAGLSIPFLNVFLVERLGADAAMVGLVRAGGTLVTAAGALTAPLLAGSLGTVVAVALSRLASVPFLWALGLTANLPLAAALYMARAALVNAAGPIISSFSMDVVAPAWRARANASLMVSWGLSYAAGSLAGGVLLAHWPPPGLEALPLRHGGYTAAFMLTGILYALATTLFWLMFRHAQLSTLLRDAGPDAPRKAGLARVR
jgi:MFS family permease